MLDTSVRRGFQFIPWSFASLRLSLDFVAQWRLRPNKVLVEIRTLIFARANPLKAINVQLALKGFVFGLVEVIWKDLVNELSWLVDAERTPIRVPPNDTVVAFFFQDL